MYNEKKKYKRKLKMIGLQEIFGEIGPEFFVISNLRLAEIFFARYGFMIDDSEISAKKKKIV